jgi:putative oxidoreductase
MNPNPLPLQSASSMQLGITLLRISLGTMWIAHALLNWLVFTLPGTAQYFQGIGYPGWVACPVIAIELLGGVALVLGVYARQVALALVPVMLVVITVHAANGWVFSAQGGGWAYPAFLTIVSVALWLLGDGAFSLRRTGRFAPSA